MILMKTETIAASHSWVTDAWEKDATNVKKYRSDS
mgnify:CR=1 FL=1